MNFPFSFLPANNFNNNNNNNNNINNSQIEISEVNQDIIFNIECIDGEYAKWRTLEQPLHSSEKINYTAMVVQNAFNNTICNKKFLEEIVEETVYPNGHEVLYVKNKLYKPLNLMHKYKYDVFETNLSKKLLKKDTNTLLTIFFRHCTLKSIVNELSLSKENPPQVINFLRQNTPSLLDQNLYVDEKGVITQKGALALLIATGYATSVPLSEINEPNVEKNEPIMQKVAAEPSEPIN